MVSDSAVKKPVASYQRLSVLYVLCGLLDFDATLAEGFHFPIGGSSPRLLLVSLSLSCRSGVCHVAASRSNQSGNIWQR